MTGNEWIDKKRMGKGERRISDVQKNVGKDWIIDKEDTLNKGEYNQHDRKNEHREKNIP